MSLIPNPTVGDRYLALLADRGVDYLFANSGTDFAPLIEGYVKAQAHGAKVPVPVTVPHENVAVSMAMGYYLVSGKPQVVMVHVSVGTANTICAITNAARGSIPVLLTAGRTPVTEEGLPGSRDIDIHWPQEMFDQAGMLRELVKWDYELRDGRQLNAVVDRALNLAMTEPRGPIYLSLPREALAADGSDIEITGIHPRNAATSPAPDPRAIDEAAAILANAETPLIIAQQAGQNHAVVPLLSELAERFAIPVVQYRQRYMSLPSDHPMHMGYEPGPLLESADAVLVLDAQVPWLPGRTGPAKGAKVIHMGADPLFSGLPIRNFPCDMAITSNTAMGLAALNQAMAEHEKSAAGRIDKRRAALTERGQEMRAGWRAAIERARDQAAITPVLLTHCLSEMKGDDAIVINEGRMPIPFLSSTRPGSYISAGHAGGLGWGLGTAIGAKMAAGPDRLVIAAEGDGSYMFSNPVPAHYVAMEQKAPFLTVIYNNRRWSAVREAVMAIYPDGYVSRSNTEPLVNFEETTHFEKAVETADGYGVEVSDPAELTGTLEKAIRVVTEEKRQAVVSVICTATQGGL